MHKRIIGLVLVLAAAFLLAACGGDDGDDGGDNPPPPTDVTPTRETDEQPQGVTGTVTTQDGSLAITLPDGWVGREVTGERIRFANSPAALTVAPSDLTEGQIQGRAIGLPRDLLAEAGLAADMPLGEAFDTLVNQSNIEGPVRTQPSDRNVFELDGRAAILASGLGTDSIATVNVLVIAVEVDGGFGFLIVWSPDVTLLDSLPMFHTLAASIQYTPG
jgi:hypothetical protein